MENKTYPSLTIEHLDDLLEVFELEINNSIPDRIQNEYINLHSSVPMNKFYKVGIETYNNKNEYFVITPYTETETGLKLSHEFIEYLKDCYNKSFISYCKIKNLF